MSNSHSFVSFCTVLLVGFGEFPRRGQSEFPRSVVLLGRFRMMFCVCFPGCPKGLACLVGLSWGCAWHGPNRFLIQ